MTQLAVRNAAAALMNIKSQSMRPSGDAGTSKSKQISRFIFTQDVLARFKKKGTMRVY